MLEFRQARPCPPNVVRPIQTIGSVHLAMVMMPVVVVERDAVMAIIIII
jgi:hypothetical protein